MAVLRKSATWALLAGLLAGCGRPPATPAGTGAREAVQGYFEALLRRDWQRAYDALDADSRARCTEVQFARLAKSYRDSLGFEPEGVHVRACEERGPEATAHVVLTGRAGSKERRYKDGASLCQTGGKWAVLLPQNFGRARR